MPLGYDVERLDINSLVFSLSVSRDKNDSRLTKINKKRNNILSFRMRYIIFHHALLFSIIRLFEILFQDSREIAERSKKLGLFLLLPRGVSHVAAMLLEFCQLKIIVQIIE